jgi:uncharacterized protein (TIGR03790 family)
MGIIFGGAEAARAGGGGENMLLVVTPTDPASLQIANAYAALRDIPTNNIVFVTPPADMNNPGGEISQAEVASYYLNPITAAISARGLTNQINYIGTIGQAIQFPIPNNLSSDASLNYALTLLTPLTNNSGLTLNNVPLTWYSTGLYQSPSSIPIGDNPAISHSSTYSAYYPAAGAYYTTQYYMSGAIGYTGTNGYNTTPGYNGQSGNTVAQVISSLQNAVAADGTHPAGTVYFEDNSDVRSTTRDGQWSTTESQLAARTLAYSATRTLSYLYESGYNSPYNRTNVMGAVCGLAGLSLPNGSTYLPGSWADNLTSYGCDFFDGPGDQTKATQFITAGAAGTTGSVTEPYAIAARFTNSSIYTFIDDGSTLGEAFAKSVAAPDIQMPLGDMLAQPYADIPTVALTSGPANYGAAKGTIAISASAGLTSPVIATGISKLELLVDGLVTSSGTLAGGSGTFSLNTANLSDGVHEVRIVGINNAQAASEGYAAQEIVVNNHGRSVNFNGGNLTLTSSAATIGLAAVAGTGTVSQVELTYLGQVLTSYGGSIGSLSLSASALAPGDDTIVPVAVFSDGMKVAGGGFVVHVESGPANGWGNGAGSGLWSNASNWTSGALPQNSDRVARFSGATGGGTVTLDASASVEEIDLDNSGGGGYTIAAAPSQKLTLSLSSTDSSASQCLVNVLSGSHTISAPLVLAAPGNLLNVTNPADRLTVSGSISGIGALTKTGSGVLTFSGSNSYTGSTAINAGDLAVNGSLASPVTVNSGGSLSGTGSLASVTVNAGGQFDPGNSSGVIRISGNLTLSLGAEMDYELDALSADNEISMPSGLLTLSGQQFSDFNFTPLAGFKPDSIYTLIAAGSISGSLGTSTSGTVDGYRATLAVQGDNLVLIVPEPSTFALLGAAALGLLAARRRITSLFAGRRRVATI